MAEAFIWGPNGQRISATQAERNRKTAEALANRVKNPQNFWEGIQSAVGDIGGSLLNWQADQAQEAGRAEVADALAAAQAGEDPNAYLSVLGNEWASPSQSAVANALLNRAWTAEDRAAGWAREDANRKADQAWDLRLRDEDWAHDKSVLDDQRAYDEPLRDLQVKAGGIGNETNQLQLDQLKTGYRQLVTPEERTAAGIPADDAGMYQISPTGSVEPIGGKSGGITINNGDAPDAALDKALSTKEGESWNGIKDAGMVAGGLGQDLLVLDELMKVAPQGPIVGPLAETFKGFSSAGDAFQSIVKRVAPSLRTPGSGATSDIEYEGFLQSLPALKNSAEANAMINTIMKAKTALNVERADIVTAYQNGELTVGEARNQLAALNKVSIITPEMKKALLGVGADGDVGSAVPQVGQVVEGYVFQGGDPSSPTSWKKQ